jgi:hypothetical protein
VSIVFRRRWLARECHSSEKDTRRVPLLIRHRHHGHRPARLDCFAWLIETVKRVFGHRFQGGVGRATRRTSSLPATAPIRPSNGSRGLTICEPSSPTRWRGSASYKDWRLPPSSPTLVETTSNVGDFWGLYRIGFRAGVAAVSSPFASAGLLALVFRERPALNDLTYTATCREKPPR